MQDHQDLPNLDPTPDPLDPIVNIRVSDLSVLIVQEDTADGGLYATAYDAGHGGQIAQWPVASIDEGTQMHREIDDEIRG